MNSRAHKTETQCDYRRVQTRSHSTADKHIENGTRPIDYETSREIFCPKCGHRALCVLTNPKSILARMGTPWVGKPERYMIPGEDITIFNASAHCVPQWEMYCQCAECPKNKAKLPCIYYGCAKVVPLPFLRCEEEPCTLAANRMIMGYQSWKVVNTFRPATSYFFATCESCACSFRSDFSCNHLDCFFPMRAVNNGAGGRTRWECLRRKRKKDDHSHSEVEIIVEPYASAALLAEDPTYQRDYEQRCPRCLQAHPTAVMNLVYRVVDPGKTHELHIPYFICRNASCRTIWKLILFEHLV